MIIVCILHNVNDFRLPYESEGMQQEGDPSENEHTAMAWFLVWHGHVLALAVPVALLVLGKVIETVLQPTEKERDMGYKPGR